MAIKIGKNGKSFFKDLNADKELYGIRSNGNEIATYRLVNCYTYNEYGDYAFGDCGCYGNFKLVRIDEIIGGIRNGQFVG